jgi:hypothetical protein
LIAVYQSTPLATAAQSHGKEAFFKVTISASVAEMIG